MAIDLKTLSKPSGQRPIIATIFGEGGMGKTTLSSMFNSPVIIRTEDGTASLTGNDNVSLFPLLLAERTVGHGEEEQQHGLEQVHLVGRQLDAHLVPTHFGDGVHQGEPLVDGAVGQHLLGWAGQHQLADGLHRGCEELV